jgi:ribonucleoside-diphosphate reductase alpha subunit
MPMLKVYNDVARYINQGGGKRNGSFAIYIEPWHSDIFTFLDAKKNHGSEELRARDLFYALWVPDLFMKAIEENGDWYLMCPDKCPGLPDVYGENFDKLYFKYVEEKRYNKKIKARELWDAIISSQIETGVPYMSYKDHVNRKSNQKNIDIIRSSNLCNEIVEVSNSEETAVCNLASICLPSILEYPNKSYHEWFDILSNEEQKLSEYYFNGNLKLFSESDCSYCKLLKALLKEVGLEYEEITEERAEDLSLFCNPVPDKFTTVPQLFSVINNKVKHLGGYTNSWNLLSPRINHNKLRDLSYDLVINLNKIIDKNYYPTEKTKVSNLRHRPIGIGVQGLADLFLCLKLPFDSPEARKINKEIFETMYYGALDSSHDLAVKEGPYSTFPGSPMSEGVFQFNMWGLNDEDLSGRWKWKVLRKNIMRNGIRNSLLVALMPTASTSQIMGSYVECFEPLTSNLYTRRTLAGEFVIINPYLIKDLISLDLWNDDTKYRLQYDKGSVKNIRNFPFKDIYRTVWEIPQKSLLEMSADRGAFVCQSQSLNLFFEKPEYKKLSMAHLAGWKLGLKTGSYYIRSKPATNAQRFAMDPEVEKRLKEEDLQNKEDTECLSCGA